MSNMSGARVIALPGMDPKNEALLADFGIGSSELRPEHKKWLAELGQRLMQEESRIGYGSWSLCAIGRASQTGSAELNMRLSIQRAEAVLDEFAALIHRPHGVKFKFLGFGKRHPLDPKNKENSLDRAVHVGIGLNEVLAPAAPKRVDIDLADIWKADKRRTRKVEVRVDKAWEGGTSISKFLTGIGYGSLGLRFTVRDTRSGQHHRFTFKGAGANFGLSSNPLPMDASTTVGNAKMVEHSLHEDFEPEDFYLGKATVEMIADGCFLIYRGRSERRSCTLHLELPTQVQAPSVNFIKHYDGRVYAGHIA
jgi:outer membrane protein OmpA-like peptidoglycan-associated protein